jgi:hypothetical protein
MSAAVGLTSITPKNDKSRSVRLTPRAAEDLQTHRQHQLDEREKLARPET